MSIKIATYGPKSGVCNICGVEGPLTEDHTPPKGCHKPTQVQIQHLISILSVEPMRERGRSSQNGVKYRTLCSRCNNSLLGTKYDPPFIAFVNAISRHLQSSLYLPSTLSIPCQPQAVLRALLGHIAAQGVDRYLKGPMTEPIRDYFLDDSLPFPTGLNAYYWAYPYRRHVMARDVAYLDIPSGVSFALWFLKFFPIAFVVTWGEPIGFEFPTQSFEPWRASSFEYQTELPLALHTLPPAAWPDNPTDRSVLLYGKEAIYAAPR